MAKKAGYSHAVSALMALLIGRLLVSYLQPWYPMVFDPLERASTRAEGWIEAWLGVELTSSVFVPLAVAGILAFAWGVVYHTMRHGTGGENR